MENEKNLSVVSNESPLAGLIPLNEEEISQSELLDDAQGLQMSFDKIKIPAGGALAFSVFDPETSEEQPMSKLKGVILVAKPSNVYFESEYTGENTQPDCASQDGINGIDKDGECHNCADCPMAQFGSGKNGVGKACANRMNLYILLEGESMPRILSLPPSALANFNSFRTSLFVARKLLRSVTVEIKLEKAQSKNKIAFSRPVFSKTGSVLDLPIEEQKNIADGMQYLRCAGVIPQ